MEKNPDFDKSKYSLDDLMTKDMRMFQLKSGFRFGVDSVLLANFAAGFIKKDSSVADLCSGCGVVPLLLLAKTCAKSVTAVEIDPLCCETMEMNVALNSLEGKMEIINANLLDLPRSYLGKFDAVSVNPPYVALGKGLKNATEAMAMARSEVSASLGEILLSAAGLLRDKGSFFMVHKTSRLAEIIQKLHEARLSPKTMRFIHSFQDKNSQLFLLRATKNGGESLEVLKPLVIYEKENVYTKEILDIYGKV